MNIENRLKKIESEMVPAEPKSCCCFQKYLQESVESMYDGPDVKTQPPDFEKSVCDKCRKPAAKEDVALAENLIRLYGDKNEH